MNSWKIILATAIIFGAGVVTGGLLVNYVDHAHHPKAVRKMQPNADAHSPNNTNRNQQARVRPPELFGRDSKDFMRQLDEMLKLTPEQHEAIQKVIAEGQSQMQKSVQNVRQDTRRKVRDQLTPDQQKQFDELMKRALRRPPSTNAPPDLPTNVPPRGL